MFQTWMVPDFQLVPCEFVIGDTFENVRLACIHPLLETEFEQNLTCEFLKRALPEMQSLLDDQYGNISLLNRRIQIVLQCLYYNFDEEPLRLPPAHIAGTDVDKFLLSAGYCVSSTPTIFDSINLFGNPLNPSYSPQYYRLHGLKSRRYNGNTVLLRSPLEERGRMIVELLGSEDSLTERQLKPKIKVKPQNLARSARVMFEGIRRQKEKLVFTEHEPEHLELNDDQFWVLDNTVCSQKIETRGRTGTRLVLSISLVDPNNPIDSCNPLFLNKVLKPTFRAPVIIQLIGTFLGCAPIDAELRRKWRSIVRYKRQNDGTQVDTSQFGCLQM